MKRTLIRTQPEARAWLQLECGHHAPRTDPTATATATVDCRDCDLRLIPTVATPTRQTPIWTAGTVPAALLSTHHTSVWAELVVVSGSVTFFDEDPAWEATASADETTVIVPGRPHHIVPADDAEFFVQFYNHAAPTDG